MNTSKHRLASVLRAAIEPLEVRRLFALPSGIQIEVLNTSGNWVTTDGATFENWQGVHVRLQKSTVGTVAGIDSVAAGDLAKYKFTWDFGDSGSEYNILPGFSAAHMFGTGTKTITLKMIDPASDNLAETTVDSVSVTINSSSFTTTYYVAENGDNSWSGTQQFPVDTDSNGSFDDGPAASLKGAVDKVNLRGAGSYRITVRRGDSFDITDSSAPSLTHDNVLITSSSSYYKTSSSDALPKLVYKRTSQNDLFATGSSAVENVTVENLWFEQNDRLNPDVKGPNCVRARGDNTVLRNNIFGSIDTLALLNEDTGNGMLVLNNQPASASYQYVLGNTVFGGLNSTNLTVLGNTMPDSRREHNLRAYSDFQNVFDNTLTNTTILNDPFNKDVNGTPLYKSKNTLRANHGSYVYWGGNTINGGTLSVGRLQPSDGGETESDNMRAVVVENNIHHQSPFFQGDTDGTSDPAFELNPGIDGLMVRNNLIESTNTLAFDVNMKQTYTGGYTRTSSDVFLLHNTVSNITRDGYIMTYDSNAADDVRVDAVTSTSTTNYSGKRGKFMYIANWSTQPTASLTVEYNLLQAPNLDTATHADSYGISTPTFSVFTSGSSAGINRNVWPDKTDLHILRGSPDTYYDTADWNSAATQVGTDMFDTVSSTGLDSKGRPTATTAGQVDYSAASGAVATGALSDLYGTLRAGVGGKRFAGAVQPNAAPDVSYIDVAFDSTGVLHTVWYDTSSKDLLYQKRNTDGSYGDILAIDSSGDVGSYVSLAIDETSGTAKPGVSYYDATNADLKFAKWNGTAWATPVSPDTNGSVGTFSSLAFNSSGKAQISYFDSSNTSLKFISASNAGGTSWNGSNTVDNTASTGRYTSIHANEYGHFSIAYASDIGSAVNLKLAAFNGTNWSDIQFVDQTAGVEAGYVSLDFDGQNRPAISCYDFNNQDMRFARRNGGGAWVNVGTVRTTGDQGSFSHLHITSTGANTNSVELYYYAASSDHVRFATNTINSDSLGSWTLTAPDLKQAGGNRLAAAWDSAGSSVFAYSTSIEQSLALEI